MSSLPQPVITPLTRAALFLVATINPGADAHSGCAPCVATWLHLYAPWDFAPGTTAFRASWELGVMRGTGFSVSRDRPDCTRSARSALPGAMPSQHQAVRR